MDNQDDNKGYVDKQLKDMVTKSYGSKEAWNKAREGNKEILAKMKINENGTESWVCEKCNHMIVADINGNRAKMKAGKNTKIFIKYTEMAAICENCGAFNTLVHSYIVDEAESITKNSDESFIQGFNRGQNEIKKNNPQDDKYELDKYLLGIK